MEKRNSTLPTLLKMVPLKGVHASNRSGVLNSAAELTSNVVEVIASAFGPNGRAVLFARGSSASSNVIGGSSLISRTGLEILEIVASKNESGTVHPLLKPLIDACRKLEVEWGDGVKSLVLITSELLRQCASLDSQRKCGWIRRELGKALACLDEISQEPKICYPPLVSPFPSSSSQCPLISSCTHEKDDPSNSVESNKLLNVDSKSITCSSEELYNLLQMFFATRFPSHVCDILPNLLCKWVKSLENDYAERGFDFIIDNFSSLCHVDAGLPTDQCSLLNGVVIHGVGIGNMFVSKGSSVHKESCNSSTQNILISDAMKDSNSSSACSSVSGLPVKVKIITKDELTNLEKLRENCSQFKNEYLYFTSCVASELIKFKIYQLGNVSLVHSISNDDLDFLWCLLHHPSSEEDSTDNFNINWARKWSRQVTRSTGLIWLGIPNIQSLILCVPLIGMAEGLKRACWNAMRLVRQFNLQTGQTLIESHKLSKYSQNQGPILDKDNTVIPSCSNSTSINPPCQDALYPTTVNLLPLRTDLCMEKLLPHYPISLKLGSLVVAGGLAEVLLHDMVIGWWLVTPLNCAQTVDRDIAKAISQACLSVPRHLSLSSKTVRKPFEPLQCNFSCKVKELIAQRLSILHYAVSVAYSLSNISDVHYISTSASNLKLSSRSSKSDSEED